MSRRHLLHKQQPMNQLPQTPQIEPMNFANGTMSQQYLQPEGSGIVPRRETYPNPLQPDSINIQPTVVVQPQNQNNNYQRQEIWVPYTEQYNLGPYHPKDPEAMQYLIPRIIREFFVHPKGSFKWVGIYIGGTFAGICGLVGLVTIFMLSTGEGKEVRIRYNNDSRILPYYIEQVDRQ